MSRRGWHYGRMIAFDTETTGVDVETARIVTAAVVDVDGATGRTDVAAWLADPGVEIPDEAAKIHGVTTEHARAHGRPAREVIAEIAWLIGRTVGATTPLVVYNAPYDITLLDRELRRHGVAVQLPDRLHVIDPLVIDKGIDRYRKGSRKLTDTAAHYGVPMQDGTAHGCEADALAAARVAWRIAATNPQIAGLSLAELHARQVAWHAEQASSFADYLRKKGKAAEADGVSRVWPMRPYTLESAAAGAVAP